MKDYEIVDDYGRTTQFTGVLLIDETTDTSEGRKPQWLEVNVWRTVAGNYVVRRTTHYRLRHTHDRCTRAEGYELIPATYIDTYPCPVCNKVGDTDGIGLGQASRISVEVYHRPDDLINSFQTNGKYNNLARAILSDLSEQEPEIDDRWNTVVVP